MERPLLPLLCATIALLLLRSAADTARCSRPKDVANAHIEVGNNVELNSRLRYSCNPGYKRKAGTSSLIQCILWKGSTEPRWTDPTLQCIRDPALSRQTPSPELPPAPRTESTIQRAGTTDASLNSGPSPASRELPVPPAPDGPSPDTSTLGEGTIPLPIAPTDYSAVTIQSTASSVVFLVLLATGIVAVCCWRRKCVKQSYTVTEADIPMVAHPSGNERASSAGIISIG